MKKAITVIAILLAATTVTFAQAKMDTTHKQMKMKMGTKKYTCPMHPEVVRSKPGKCPKCGMDLVEKKMKMAQYTCTMHPEVVKNKPGKCPKCNMKLTKMKMDKSMGDMKM